MQPQSEMKTKHIIPLTYIQSSSSASSGVPVYVWAHAQVWTKVRIISTEERNKEEEKEKTAHYHEIKNILSDLIVTLYMWTDDSITHISVSMAVFIPLSCCILDEFHFKQRFQQHPVCLVASTHRKIDRFMRKLKGNRRQFYLWFQYFMAFAKRSYKKSDDFRHNKIAKLNVQTSPL